jgi:hypothetical protein
MSGDEVRVLLVAGTGQNGATLLSRVLGGVPGFCAIGEIGHLWDTALIDGRECGCGKSVRGCPFWSEVGKQAFGAWDNVDARHATELRVRSVQEAPFIRSFPSSCIGSFVLVTHFRSTATGGTAVRSHRLRVVVAGDVDSMVRDVYAMSLRAGSTRECSIRRDREGSYSTRSWEAPG